MRDLTEDRNEDHKWLARALQLAAKGEGLASPNPMVGAVLVRDGEVIAEGFHTYDGLRHAEIIALEAAGEKARGATLYVNLEPCCHTGRTGPCTRALIAADPLLTDRSGLPRRRPLLRVVLDSRLRVSPKSQVVRSADGDVLVFTSASASSARGKTLAAHGVEICHVRARRGRPDPRAVLEELRPPAILRAIP